MEKLKVLDLFSGIGGFSLGLERTGGFRTIGFCEIEEFPRVILKKHWPDIPIHKDVRSLHATDLQETVDVVCGGFPCQDLSQSGHQKGLEGERSSLYREMLRIISEGLPRYAVFENVTALLTGNKGKWFGQFLYDLAQIGYDAEWHCISASAIGAAHHRDRTWIVAYPNGSIREGSIFSQSIRLNTEEPRRRQLARAIDACLPADDYAKMRGDFDDVPEQMGALKAFGNSVVPAIPELIGRAILQVEKARYEAIAKELPF